MPPKGHRKNKIAERPVEIVREIIPPAAPALEIAQTDCMRYHETERPKVFKSGSSVPVGWNLDNRRLWTIDGFGAWTRVNR